MSVVARYNPTNLTAEKYAEASRRLEEAGLWPSPDGLDYHVCFGSEGTYVSAKSGTLGSSSMRIASA